MKLIMRTLFNIKSISQFLFLIGFIFLSKTSFETTIYVNKFASGLNNGTSWVNAFVDLQDGLAVAVNGDQIWVKGPAIYYPDKGTGDRTKSFQLKSGVELYGGFVGGETSIDQRNYSVNLTILSGEIGSQLTIDDNSYTVIDASSALFAVLDGFYIFRGNANNLSGGVKAYRGGGIYINNAACTFANCVIRENNAIGDGGGVFLNGLYSLFKYCTFLDNTTTAGNGGAIRSNGNTTNTELEGCIFTNNRALSTSTGTGKGAAFFTDRYSKIKGCVFRDNIGNQGPAIYVQHSVTNPVTSLAIEVNNCTVINNRGLAANNSSSAIFASNTVANSEIKILARNCILYNNIANTPITYEKQISSETTSLPVILYLTYSDIQGYISGIFSGDIGNIGDNPDFIIDPTGTSYHISENSPCKNTGDPSLIPNVFITINNYGKYDVDKEARISDTAIDMGADELRGRLDDPDIHPLKRDLLLNDENKTKIYGLKLYPNPPTSEKFQIKYELYEPAVVSVRVFSINGQVESIFNNTIQEAGLYDINILTFNKKLSNGIYVIELKVDDEIFLERFVIVN